MRVLRITRIVSTSQGLILRDFCHRGSAAQHCCCVSQHQACAVGRLSSVRCPLLPVTLYPGNYDRITPERELAETGEECPWRSCPKLTPQKPRVCQDRHCTPTSRMAASALMLMDLFKEPARVQASVGQHHHRPVGGHAALSVAQEGFPMGAPGAGTCGFDDAPGHGDGTAAEPPH